MSHDLLRNKLNGLDHQNVPNTKWLTVHKSWKNFRRAGRAEYLSPRKGWKKHFEKLKIKCPLFPKRKLVTTSIGPFTMAIALAGQTDKIQQGDRDPRFPTEDDDREPHDPYPNKRYWRSPPW